MKTALIVGGGYIDPLTLASIRSPSNLVICADRGAEIALEAGIVPDIIIGDMDSLSTGTTDHFLRMGVPVTPDGSRDHLDTELAILKAVEMGAERLVILGAWGDRIDQSLASLTFLTPWRIPVSKKEKDGCSFQGEVFIVTDRCLIQRVTSGSPVPCTKGTRAALVPLPHASGVTTRGLLYELHDADLDFTEHWSVSNSVLEGPVGITFDSGELAFVRWFDTASELRSHLREFTGRAHEGRKDHDYHRVLGEIYNHGGKSPDSPGEKERRLKFTRKLLDELCPSHNDIKLVHIAGTSGKGSVALYLRSILSGKSRTGLVISPHLYDFNERVRVDSRSIPHDDVVRIWNMIRGPIEKMERESGETVLFQEIILIIAFIHFREQEVEWAVVETGLGGRFDQTRVLDPEITAITQIDLDHTHILGNTITEIAHEKAGIIRPGIPLFTTERKEEVLSIFGKTCDERSAQLIRTFPGKISYLTESRGMEFHHDQTGYSIPQVGEHQAVNANLAVAIAVAIACGSGVDQHDIQDGLDRTLLPGRIEVRGKLIIDTAHNTGELHVLARTLKKIVPVESSRVVICGMAETKDHLPMLREIGNLADFIIFTRAGYRGEDPMKLMRKAGTLGEFDDVRGVMVEENPRQAYALGRLIREQQAEKGEESYLIVTGSTFIVDEIFNPDETLRRINSGEMEFMAAIQHEGKLFSLRTTNVVKPDATQADLHGDDDVARG